MLKQLERAVDSLQTFLRPRAFPFRSTLWKSWRRHSKVAGIKDSENNPPAARGIVETLRKSSGVFHFIGVGN